MFNLCSNPSLSSSPETRQKPATASLESAVDAQRSSQWLILCRPQGVIEVNFLLIKKISYSLNIFIVDLDTSQTQLVVFYIPNR